MAKQIVHGEESRQVILGGVNLMANAHCDLMKPTVVGIPA